MSSGHNRFYTTCRSMQFCTLCTRVFDRSDKRTMKFDDFIQCCVMLRSLTESFKRSDTNRTGVITISYEQVWQQWETVLEAYVNVWARWGRGWGICQQAESASSLNTVVSGWGCYVIISLLSLSSSLRWQLTIRWYDWNRHHEPSPIVTLVSVKTSVTVELCSPYHIVPLTYMFLSLFQYCAMSIVLYDWYYVLDCLLLLWWVWFLVLWEDPSASLMWLSDISTGQSITAGM